MQLEQNYIRNRDSKFYFVLIFCLSSVHFFNPAIISANFLYYIYYGLFALMVFYITINYKKTENKLFVTPILLFILAQIISAFSATYSWDQSLTDSFKALLPSMSYVLFFLLLNLKLRVHDIEKIIIILGVLFIIVFFITYLTYPRHIFGNVSHYGDERGFQRIAQGGLSFLFLFSFYSLNQYYNKGQFWWLVIYIITIVCVIMTLTRTLIIISFILSALYILRKSKFIHKIIAITIIGCFIGIITQMSFFKIMVEESKSQASNKNDDIRVLSAYYYINNFSPNTFARIFGNGEPYKDTKYAHFVEYLEMDLGLFRVDVGYIGLYATYGILAILAYLIFIYKTIKMSVPEEYLYCKYFLYFVFLTSVIIDFPYSREEIAPIVLAAYILSSKDLLLSNSKSAI